MSVKAQRSTETSIYEVGHFIDGESVPGSRVNRACERRASRRNLILELDLVLPALEPASL